MWSGNADEDGGSRPRCDADGVEGGLVFAIGRTAVAISLPFPDGHEALWGLLFEFSI